MILEVLENLCFWRGESYVKWFEWNVQGVLEYWNLFTTMLVRIAIELKANYYQVKYFDRDNFLRGLDIKFTDAKICFTRQNCR